MAAVFCLAMSSVASADVMTLRSQADTGLFENAPDNNLGAQEFMPVGISGVGTLARGLIRFDLSQIPTNAIISNATLTVRVSFFHGINTYTLHRMLVSWTEGNKSGGPVPTQGSVGAFASDGESTWNNRFHPGTEWGLPGGAANTDFVSTSSGSISVAGVGTFTFSSANVLGDVRRWVTNSASNFGWMIKDQSEFTAGNANRISTREDRITANAPMLTVTFGVPISAPSVTTASPMPRGLVSQNYSQTLTGINGSPPYSWTISAGALPPGLQLAASGLLSGKPTNGGTYNFTARLTDSQNAIATKALVLTIDPKPRITLLASPRTQIRFEFEAVAGRTYAVEVQGGLGPLQWQTLSNFGSSLVNTNRVISELTTNPPRFYRVRTP